MTKLVKALQIVARLHVALQLLLGFLIWFGTTGVTQAHTALGSAFVLDLWALGIVGLFALPSRTIPLLTLVMGAIVLWLGVAQRTMLVGDLHWAVRLVHLLVSVSAMGLVEAVAKAVRIQHAQAPDTFSPGRP
jgi:hypothetical protein